MRSMELTRHVFVAFGECRNVTTRPDSLMTTRERPPPRFRTKLISHLVRVRCDGITVKRLINVNPIFVKAVLRNFHTLRRQNLKK